MTTKKNPKDDTLSIEEIILTAGRSNNASVQDALKKLEFLIRLSHSEEEIDRWKAEQPSYNIRIGLPVNDHKRHAYYEYIRLNVKGDMASLLANQYEVSGRLKTGKENIFYMGSL